MDAKIQGIDDLFDHPVSYRIPQFQRPYAWSKTQWEPLWDDVRQIADRILEHGQKDLLPHFMGSIVLQPMKSMDGGVSWVLVIDGQQRLTTLQILLKAMQTTFEGSLSDTGKIKNLNKLLLNDYLNEVKIRQSNKKDKAAFQDVMFGEIDANCSRLITKAYKYFHEKVDEWVSLPANVDVGATALYDVLTKHLKVPAIILDIREKPHFIFEILNARGEPLKQADLIKNRIMYEANCVDNEEKAKKLWGMFEDDWWREKDGKGENPPIRLDRFLNYWLIMHVKEYFPIRQTAAKFHNYIEQYKPNIEEVAQDIRKAGLVYWKIEKNKLPRIEEFLERIKIMDIGVIMPPLLWLYTNDVSEGEQQRSADALESYLVRRMLCKTGAAGLNKLFIDMVMRLEKQKGQPADDTVIQFLKEKFAVNLWPDDDKVVDYLAMFAMPGNLARKKMVLVTIENKKREERGEKLLELDNTKNLTVQPILPRGGWGNNPDDKLDGFVDFIGNLTLADKKLKSPMANKSWENKQKVLRQPPNNGLCLNEELLENAPEVWDEKAIWERSKQLAQAIVQIWLPTDKI